ncbi:2Fe-2S iron-sulfur cluster-binding protein [Brevibacillus fulvus]|uniref:2Fe-2S ferredoxin n=1 Tax=Brevibacillus fulvus TaxID=1125967 RepID=A0A938XR70_9BACL|nr:2Fe-2S iron-sulfur cluster-binding protein [Brevibacillus fulvus]MBM7588698.1 2Fe-2S ferredoxin [Brevibacillus fulvus]
MEQLTMCSRQGAFTLPIETGQTIVQIAKTANVPWGYLCERGICAQCRTKVEEGMEYLNPLTEAEKKRLRKAERTEGYRLGCQMKIETPGSVRLVHKPY